jgi:hypothetical protein
VSFAPLAVECLRKIVSYVIQPMDSQLPVSWTTKSKKTIRQYSKFSKVEEHAVDLPDGRIFPDWPVVVIPDAVIILARTQDVKFFSFK